MLDVGMTPHYAGGRTGYIGQNGVKWAAVPPALDIAAIGNGDGGLQIQALQVFFNPPCPPGVDIERQQIEICHFQQMRGLAAGRRTGIKHARARLWRKQFGSALRPCILHRNNALKKTGQSIDRYCLVQNQAMKPFFVQQRTCR